MGSDFSGAGRETRTISGQGKNSKPGSRGKNRGVDALSKRTERCFVFYRCMKLIEGEL